MKRALAAAFVAFAVAAIHATESTAPDPATEGQRIAAWVRELQLTEDARGVLKIYRGRPLFAEVPFQITTSTTSSNWTTTYRATSTNSEFRAALAVHHTPGATNHYLYGDPKDGCHVPLGGEGLMQPFAGSDYNAVDLGLEFLHWPEQRLLTNQLRRSQSCHKLESTNPAPGTNSYTRVISWIDIDTGGIVEAEAWDAKGKLKIFEPTSVQKIKGRYVVRELEIRNRRTGNRTVIVLDYGK